MKIKYLKELGLFAFLGTFLIILLGAVNKFSPPPVMAIHKGKVLAAATSTPPNVVSPFDDLKTRVQALIQENNDLKNKTQQFALEDPVRRVLKRGMSGDDVLAAETLLEQSQGKTEIEPTKYFGKLTEKAVKTFQEQENLPITGIIDADTLSHISASINDLNPLDNGQYDGLLQQLDGIANACSPTSILDASLSDTGQNASTTPTVTSTDASALAQPDSLSAGGICPAGCIPQDQLPDCPAPPQDTRTMVDPAPPLDTAPTPAPTPTPGASSTTTPQTTKATATPTSTKTPIASTTPTSTKTATSTPPIIKPTPTPTPTPTPSAAKTATSTQVTSHK